MSRASRPGSESPAAPATASERDPRIRPVAAALLALEAVLLVAVATFCFVGVSGGQLDGRFGTGLGVFLLLFAAGAAVAARSILVRGRFGLGYGITWQLFQALVGASMLSGGLVWQGALGLVVAIAAFLLLLSLVRSTPLPTGEGR
ncbi:hypothetical protein NLU66_09420 [Brachybacterium sp. NBEC-018]|uniref:hypothetical protein n=1 Tax=Brachybacterium sp. NBEC-018 TaxID=2996004 RepID=UPI00217502C5|nr:hypothetical protein [Brachybacterium sp. NBEC-018]UVY82464.1 hypothetical protein NLU66_09420 [Brachybacterium sp. NBEC-018]